MNCRKAALTILLASALATLGIAEESSAERLDSAEGLIDTMWEKYRSVTTEVEDLEILVVSAPDRDVFDETTVDRLIEVGGPGVLHKRARRHTRYEADRSDKIRVEFSLPREDAGTTFLVHRSTQRGKDEQWLYLPAIRRVRRVPVSSSQTFVGTDFIYEDIRGLSGERVGEFEYAELEKASVDGVECRRVRATPKEETDSAYGARVIWIDMERVYPLKVEFEDTRGKPWKVMTHRAIDRMAGDAFRSGLVEMRDLRIGETTLLRIKRREVNVDIPAHLFSRDSLGR